MISNKLFMLCFAFVLLAITHPLFCRMGERGTKEERVKGPRPMSHVRGEPRGKIDCGTPRDCPFFPQFFRRRASDMRRPRVHCRAGARVCLTSPRLDSAPPSCQLLLGTIHTSLPISLAGPSIQTGQRIVGTGATTRKRSVRALTREGRQEGRSAGKGKGIRQKVQQLELAQPSQVSRVSAYRPWATAYIWTAILATCHPSTTLLALACIHGTERDLGLAFRVRSKHTAFA